MDPPIPVILIPFLSLILSLPSFTRSARRRRQQVWRNAHESRGDRWAPKRAPPTAEGSGGKIENEAREKERINRGGGEITVGQFHGEATSQEAVKNLQRRRGRVEDAANAAEEAGGPERRHVKANHLEGSGSPRQHAVGHGPHGTLFDRHGVVQFLGEYEKKGEGGELRGREGGREGGCQEGGREVGRSGVAPKSPLP